jgi:hypothetical protein
VTLVLLSKPDCHLCHEMADVVRAVLGDRASFVIEDVRSRPEWSAYRYEIPVLLWGSQEVIRHRATEAQLRERLAAVGFTS